MQLHAEFVRTARRYSGKLAIKDRSTGRELTYQKALIAALILSRKVHHHHDGFIGIMVPTSRGQHPVDPGRAHGRQGAR